MKKVVGYIPFFPKAKERPEYPGCLDSRLTRSMDELKQVLEDNKDKNYVSFDTETTGLNPEKDFIVGFSFAFCVETGYYVPVKHFTGPSLGKEALDLIYNFFLEIAKKKGKVFLFNVRFDFRMMEYAGYDMSIIPYYDVFIGCWLADTNIRMKSLKWYEKELLGWDPQHFEEALDGASNFYYTNAEDSFRYAAVDAQGTFALCSRTVSYIKESGLAAQLDNQCLYPLMKYEENKIDMDSDYLSRMYNSEINVMYYLRELIKKN